MDNFREWLSDNLRYFMLGGVALIIVAVLFFGIRACTGSNKGNSSTKQDTTTTDNQGNDPSSPAKDGETDDGQEEDANPLVAGDADVTALITKYYEALGAKDIDTLRTLEDDLTPSDEAKVTNAKDYIEGYEVGDIYTKNGLTENSYVVYAKYNYICKGITTKVPALSMLYVMKDAAGDLKIDAGAERDAEISAYTTKLESDADVVQLVADVTAQYNQAQQDDSALAEFLNGLGEDASTSTSAATKAEDGTTLTASEGCNVRAAADLEADVIGELAAGDEVVKQGQDGDWTQIDYNGETGYVYSSLLE